MLDVYILTPDRCIAHASNSEHYLMSNLISNKVSLIS